MRDCFAISFVPASESTRSATALNLVQGTFQYSSDGTRTFRVARPILAGTTTLGIMKPASTNPNLEDIHIQGSRVDYPNYIRTLEMKKFQDLKIKTGAPFRNKSSNHFGDRYFYNGAHMFESTYQELLCIQSEAALEPKYDNASESVTLPSINNVIVDDKYRAARALVGQTRLSKLERMMRWKVTDWEVGGALGDVIKACPKLMSENFTWLTAESLHFIARAVGIDMSESEARALFGVFDQKKIGKVELRAMIEMLIGQR